MFQRLDSTIFIQSTYFDIEDTPDIISDKNKGEEQNENEATYSPNISKEEEEIKLDEKYYTKKGSPGYTPLSLEQSEKKKYENIIKKLEEKERILYNYHLILISFLKHMIL